jgi:phage shock protein A
MLDDIKKAFSEAWTAFRTEAGRREPEDQVAELLIAMRREMVAARADLPLHDQTAQRAAAELERERALLADCERRRGLAEKIGDAETVRVAGEFAERHRARVTVLEAKTAAAAAERDLRRREAEEMMRRYKEADANRFALLAEIRARQAGRTLGRALGSDSPLGSDFDRHASRIDERAAYADALDELDGSSPTPPPPPPSDVDDRLAELKRRTGMQ